MHVLQFEIQGSGSSGGGQSLKSGFLNSVGGQNFCEEGEVCSEWGFADEMKNDEMFGLFVLEFHTFSRSNFKIFSLLDILAELPL